MWCPVLQKKRPAGAGRELKEGTILVSSVSSVDELPACGGADVVRHPRPLAAAVPARLQVHDAGASPVLKVDPLRLPRAQDTAKLVAAPAIRRIRTVDVQNRLTARVDDVDGTGLSVVAALRRRAGSESTESNCEHGNAGLTKKHVILAGFDTTTGPRRHAVGKNFFSRARIAHR